MALNNKGQVVFYALMLGIVVVVIALSLTPVVNQFVLDAKNTTDDTRVGLDCENPASDYIKSQCVLTDIATPYFFFGMIGIALLIIGAKAVLT